MEAHSGASVRETYRHGDLRRVLIEAGFALARAGGPEAVVLREVTRRAGVAPNAAYRHFTSLDDLMHAVRDAALAALAGAIEREIAALDPDVKRKAFARAGLRAVGLGYLAFAVEEPGLFRTAFVATTATPGPPTSGRPDPFELFGWALDKMVTADLMPPHRRPGAEYLAWSSVHGLAMLLNEGPLSMLARVPAGRNRLADKEACQSDMLEHVPTARPLSTFAGHALDPTRRAEIGERLVRMVERGL